MATLQDSGDDFGEQQCPVQVEEETLQEPIDAVALDPGTAYPFVTALTRCIAWICLKFLYASYVISASIEHRRTKQYENRYR